MSLTVIAVKRTVQEQKQHSLVLFMRSDLKCELTTLHIRGSKLYTNFYIPEQCGENQ